MYWSCPCLEKITVTDDKKLSNIHRTTTEEASWAWDIFSGMDWEPFWIWAYRSTLWQILMHANKLLLTCISSNSIANLTDTIPNRASIGSVLFQHTFIVPKLCYTEPWVKYNGKSCAAIVCHTNTGSRKKSYKVYNVCCGDISSDNLWMPLCVCAFMYECQCVCFY